MCVLAEFAATPCRTVFGFLQVHIYQYVPDFCRGMQKGWPVRLNFTSQILCVCRYARVAPGANPLEGLIEDLNDAGKALSATEKEVVMAELPKAFSSVGRLFTVLAHPDLRLSECCIFC